MTRQATPSHPLPPPAPPFRVVYADPPWRIQGGVRLPYPTMSARKTSAPCRWRASAPRTARCCCGRPTGRCPTPYGVMAAWGFAYKTVAFTWAKTNRTRPGFFVGQGGWTRANAEVCLLGTRGRPKRMGANVPGLVASPRREHSRKPDEVRDADRVSAGGRASGGAVRAAEGARLERVGQRGGVRLRPATSSGRTSADPMDHRPQPDAETQSHAGGRVTPRSGRRTARASAPGLRPPASPSRS